jgi:clan AA aspartic protease (TIGR02281 family)
MKLFLGAFLVSFCLLSVGVSAQEIYHWVEENGRIHFTDNYLSIPQIYLDKVEKRRFLSTNRAAHQLILRTQLVSSARLIVVPFTRRGNKIIVEGIVNGRSTIKFILDTGADLTIIPRSLVQQSGISVDSSSTVPLTGISGTVISPLVKIDSLKVGEAEVRKLDGVIIEESTLPGHGLLGGNFLREFWVAIDYTENLLILDRRMGTGM